MQANRRQRLEFELKCSSEYSKAVNGTYGKPGTDRLSVVKEEGHKIVGSIVAPAICFVYLKFMFFPLPSIDHVALEFVTRSSLFCCGLFNMDLCNGRLNVRRYLLGYFRWNDPRKHSERKEVSEYSDEPRPSEYSEKLLPSEYSEEVYPSGYSEEICPRNIPRKLSSEYPEGYTSSEYSQK
ncbi:hypothetical protein DY000_02004372 [Brassica cretica]|uniref:Uncharacterized protein n=1 Tax=Brassica cretica TaxID=69181 RepID=A0ABQ7C0P1_BRACR|nr:hypothetical protein DY000_02004372 [Brassica cretica]